MKSRIYRASTFVISLSLLATALTGLHALAAGTADLVVSGASLDDNEKRVEPVGIVGFSFKYVGQDHPVVGNILPEGPAAALDIKAGDEILAIEKQDTALLSIQSARKLLTGKPGTTLTIRLSRPAAGAIEKSPFDITLRRMSSAQITDKRLRSMVEHAKQRESQEESAPLLLCHLSEPGPSVVELSAGAAHDKLLAAKEKQGLSVKHINIADKKYAPLFAALKLKAGAANLYYFAGILTTHGHFEKRPLTDDILNGQLKSINWLPGQNALHKAMIDQYEALRKQSWQPGNRADREQLLNTSLANPKREEAIKIFKQYVQLHNAGDLETKSFLSPEARTLGLPPLGKLSFDLSSGSANFNVVADNYAVARTKLEGAKPLDVYFYLRRDKQWKITAARALACTGPLSAIADELQAKKTLSPEERDTLSNLKLTLATDSELKEWFKQNNQALNDMVQMGSQLPAGTSVIVSAQTNENTAIKEKLSALHLASLNKVDSSQIEIIVGGVTDNNVGFLYAPDNRPPLLGPSEYIWVEKIADKWYLFRTT